MFRRGVMLVAFVLCLPRAQAYVRELNAPTQTGGVPLSWQRGCVFIQLSPQGPRGLPLDAVLAATEQSGRNWTDLASTQCGTYMRFVFERSTQPIAARRDLRNAVIWYQDVSQSVALRQNQDAPAITTLTSIRIGGSSEAQIIDADTEINDESPLFRWGILDPSNPDPNAYDIENTLTHEFGHTLGLGHSCWDGRPDSNRTDHANALIPACPATGAAAEATMYYSELPGEYSKRTPLSDELQGICDLYPATSTPPACLPLLETSELVAGCAMGSGASLSGRATGILLATLWLALSTMRRRCRKRKFKYAP